MDKIVHNHMGPCRTKIKWRALTVSVERPHKELDHTWHRLALSWSTAAGVCYLFSYYGTISAKMSCAHVVVQQYTDIPAGGRWCRYISAPWHVWRTLAPHTQNQVGSPSRRPFQHCSAPDCLQEDRVVKIECSISRSEHLWQPLHNTVGNAWVGIVGDHYIYYYHYIQLYSS